MNTLIENIKNRKYKFISITTLNPKDDSTRPKIRKIISASDEGVMGLSNMVVNGLKIFTRFPTEGNYKLIDDGYIELVNCGKYGIVEREVKFKTSI